MRPWLSRWLWRAAASQARPKPMRARIAWPYRPATREQPATHTAHGAKKRVTNRQRKKKQKGVESRVGTLDARKQRKKKQKGVDSRVGTLDARKQRKKKQKGVDSRVGGSRALRGQKETTPQPVHVRSGSSARASAPHAMQHGLEV